MGGIASGHCTPLVFMTSAKYIPTTNSGHANAPIFLASAISQTCFKICFSNPDAAIIGAQTCAGIDAFGSLFVFCKN